MKITAMDINNKEFKKSLRGYDCDEVDEFLDNLADDYETLYKDNSALKEKIEILEEKIEHYAKIESTIQSTLLLAQNAAEQAKQSAQTEAEMIIKKANDEAKKVIDKSHSDVIKVNDEYEVLKQEFIKFRSKYKSFMNAQIDTFNSLEKDFVKSYNIGNTVESEPITHKTIENKKENVDEIDQNDLDVIKSFFTKENK